MTGKQLTHCLACGNNTLETILDFEMQPLANSYRELGELDQPEPQFPLGLNYCTTCHHLQLPYAVNPDLMFKDYKYVSGTSQTLRDYFDWFAHFSHEYWCSLSNPNNHRFKNVLDIACNDGSQLDSFKKLLSNINTYGIDPAENLFPVSSGKGHNILKGYLDDKTIASIKGQLQFDIINAQNVFAHNSDPSGFLKQCSHLMNYSTLLFIQNSQADMIKNGEFDTIYHEHHSFWNLSSMDRVAKNAGLFVIDRIRTPIHGTSDLFVLAKYPRGFWLKNALEMEKKEGLHNLQTYMNYADDVYNTINLVADEIYDLGAEGNVVIGYGAAAKGMTLLNVAGIKLDLIIDDNPLKQGLWTPGVRIPITSREKFQTLFPETERPIVFVPLAWNFFDEIKMKIKEMRPNCNDRFLKYFPEVKLVS